MKAARTIRRGDEEWPTSLGALRDSPEFLRVRGRLPRPGERAVSVVGSRVAGPEGLDLARRIGRALARAGTWVVSGGAVGVDAAAHAGAIEEGGRTAVILGGGLDHLYPAGNRELFARVVESGGGLAAEVEDGVRAATWSFPRRNRIVAALGEATVVVRAGARSGALVTAERAMRLGRPVWIAGEAGPGEREGLARLAAGGARTFGSLAELVDRLGLGERAGAAAGRGTGPGAGLRGPAAALWGALDREPRPTDDVALRAGIGAGEALAALMELELLGLVERRPGRGFARRAGG
jgi:DNA processing protein